MVKVMKSRICKEEITENLLLIVFELGVSNFLNSSFGCFAVQNNSGEKQVPFPISNGHTISISQNILVSIITKLLAKKKLSFILFSLKNKI